MKKSNLSKLLFGLLFLGMCLSSSAQIKFSISFDRTSYLQYEEIKATLTLINNSGTRLEFGDQKDTGGATFLITDDNDSLVKSFKDNFNLMKGLKIAAGETKSIEFVINDHFPMAKPGTFKIKAEIRHKLLGGQAFVVPNARVRVTKGITLHTNTFGIVDIKDSTKVHQRSYDIISFRPSTTEPTVLCLKIYDKEWVHALHRIGPRVSGIPVSHDVDTFSNIHTLVEIEARKFLHTVYSSGGEVKQIIVYDASLQSVPQMARDPKLGKVGIVGGRKMTEGKDYIRRGGKIYFTDDKDEAI